MTSSQLTKARVLELAGQKEFFVSKYTWKHDYLRKMTRRMLKDGELVLVEANKRGFVYRRAS